MATTVSCREAELGGCAIAELCLSSDNGANPLSVTAVAALREQLKALDRRGPPHIVVLRSEGRFFSAGADLQDLASMTPAGFGAFMKDILALYAEMTATAKPIIAVVHADALGGGAGLAQFADFVIAADTARFGFPEALRGLAGAGYLTPRLLGKQLATELALTGRLLSATEMQRLGMVNEVCGGGELPRRLEALIERLGRISPTALATGKRSLHGGLFVGLEEAMRRHIELQVTAFADARGRGLV